MADNQKNIFSWFGRQFGYDTSNSNDIKQTPSPVSPFTSDGAKEIEVSFAGHNVFGNTFELNYENEKQLIEQYRTMSLDGFVDDGISEIINRTIALNNDEPVSINLEDTDFSKNIQDKINEEFLTILKILNFKRDGYSIFKNWYVDGRLVGFKRLQEQKESKDGLTVSKQGISKVEFIDPRYIRYIREVYTNEKGEKHVKDEYFIYDDIAKGGGNRQYRLEKDAVVYVPSGLVDNNQNTIGYLHKAFKPYNQLASLEDSMVVHRIVRAPQRRIFYVDVGNLPGKRAEQYMTEITSKYNNKVTYDSTTGSMTSKTAIRSMLEDIWLPRKNGQKGTEVSTLEGQQKLGDNEDIIYFKKKLYRALGIPDSMVDSQSGTVNFAKTSTETTKEELKFKRFINEIRTKFSVLFLDLLKTQLIVKKIITQEEWEDNANEFQFIFADETFFFEIKETELHNLRLDLFDRVITHVGSYYSKEYIQTHILKMSDKEISDMNTQIQNEKDSSEIHETSPFDRELNSNNYDTENQNDTTSDIDKINKDIFGSDLDESVLAFKKMHNL